MDIYTHTLIFLLESSIGQSWPEMKLILERITEKKPREWQLPMLSCAAIGGTQARVIPASAAIASLQISIILIDDMLDADPRGEYHHIGKPATANLAAGFQALGLGAITRSKAPFENKLATLHNLNQMLLTTTLGQYLDAQNLNSEEDYWHLVRRKSSPFFGAALHAGALMGGGALYVAAQIKELGHIYGEMIQIHDDLNDAMAIPANPDWTLGRFTLPVLFAQTVEHPEKERFVELRKSISAPDALEEAQNILIRCGAVSYCIDQLIERYQRAMDLLSRISLKTSEPLERLFDDVIVPVTNLLDAVGVDNPEALLHVKPLTI
ncbi:MAG: polyprenyl synthetase family protein [Chloroflexi bacterium]|nr:polyprenyl synthetase family protein [Chloroflexota bacterium]